ncbi:hypothetical protein Pmar_PMAR002421, partial [Perkinsus marinus ATCC 50983]
YLPERDEDGRRRHRKESRGTIGRRRRRIKRRCKRRCQSWCGQTLITQSAPTSPHILTTISAEAALKRLQEGGRPGTPAVTNLSRGISLNLSKDSNMLEPLVEHVERQHLSQPSMTRWSSDDTFSVTESEGSLSPTSPRLRLKDFKSAKKPAFLQSPSREGPGKSLEATTQQQQEEEEGMSPRRSSQYLIPPHHKVERQHTNSSCSEQSSNSELWESLESLPKLQIPSALPSLPTRRRQH